MLHEGHATNMHPNAYLISTVSKRATYWQQMVNDLDERWAAEAGLI